ncbi:MAG: hypothetical protein ACREHD_14620 [Pirellulales bacterium]
MIPQYSAVLAEDPDNFGHLGLDTCESTSRLTFELQVPALELDMGTVRLRYSSE